MTERSCTSLLNPFPGLRAFGPGDAHLLFGRTAGCDEVIAKLHQTRFVSVLGASGSGKSSLVQSGVIPRLLAENTEGKRSWSYAVLRPNNNPIDALANELSALSAAAGFAYVSPMAASIALHNDSEGLGDVVSRIRKNLRQRIILVIDQFEEIFRYSTDQTKGQSGDNISDFVNLLIAAVKQEDTGLYIIVTMQSDFIPECSRFESLISLMNSGSYLIPQIKGAAYAEIIEEPLRLTKTPIDGKLVNTIILEAGNKAGYLPQMQHMLMRLWDQWNKCSDTSRSIGITDYDAIGRLDGALSNHAGKAYSELSEKHKFVCERLFKTITASGKDRKGKRKPEKISVIQAITCCSLDDLIAVIEIFRSSQYSFLTPGPETHLTPDTVIDVSHESIIASWDLLRKWVEEEEESQKLYLRLSQSASKHQEGKENFWSPPELILAINWREKLRPSVAWAERIDPAYERTMLFLSASEDEYITSEIHKENELRNKLRWTKVLGLLFAAFTLVSIALIGNYLSVKAKALKNEALALSQKEQVMLLNRQLTDSLDITVQSKIFIEAEAVAAREHATIAEREASIATHQTTIAVKAKEEAEIKAGEEFRKRMLSVGKSLAVRSLSFQNENDLQAILAYQAFLFNDRNGGFSNDADIFNSLYVLNKKIGNRYYSLTETGLGNFTAMANSPDGKYLFGADKRGNVFQWQGSRPDQHEKIIWSGNRIIESLAVSPDGQWLACGTTGADIVMLPMNTNVKSYELNGEGLSEINSLAYSSDGNVLFASTHEGSISEWHFIDHIEKSYKISGVEITDINISPDNRILAALTTDGRAIIVPVDFSSKPEVINTGDERITALAFIPWSKKMILGNDEGFIEMWDLKEKRAVDIIEAHRGRVELFAFCVDSKQIASAGNDKVIKLWAGDNMLQPPVTFTDNPGNVTFIGYTPEGRSVVSASNTGTLIQRPAQVQFMTGTVCSTVNRNLSPEEWEAYVGDDIPYEKTCEEKSYKIKATRINSSE